MSSSPRLLSVLIPLALAGCASQEAVEPAAYQQDRLDRLEQMVRSAADPGRYAALERAAQDDRAAIARLDQEQRALVDRLARNGQRYDALAGQGGADRAVTAERLDRIEQRLDALSASVREALALASQEYLRLNGKEAFTVALTEDRAMYPINSPELARGDLAQLDELMARLAGLGQEYHLEIQGHADNIGPEDYNYELGKARAEVVKRHLHDRKGVPLSQMSVISFGSSRPQDAASLHNRRILIRVLVPK
ncbi:MAG: OmpA family protein [Gallionellaceae bacterium]|nr:OmpA family protein [Gallionellaceae bacterium]